MEVLRSEKESLTRELTAIRGENEMLCLELDQTKTELSVAREKVVQLETAIPRTTFPFSARTPVFNPVLFPTSTSSISTPFSFSSVSETTLSSWSLPAPTDPCHRSLWHLAPCFQLPSPMLLQPHYPLPMWHLLPLVTSLLLPVLLRPLYQLHMSRLLPLLMSLFP